MAKAKPKRSTPIASDKKVEATKKETAKQSKKAPKSSKKTSRGK